MKDNPLHFNKKRPRRFKGRPGVSSNPTNSDSADMDSNAEEAGDPSPEVVQDIAEAVMAEQDKLAGEAAASPEASAESADDASASASPVPPPPSNNNQRQNQSRDPQAQAQAAQQRREQEQQRREQENQRRQQENQRREQERLRREEDVRRRQQEQARREAEDRARMPMDDLCKKAWDIYLAEVSEEGVELFPDNDARELSRRSFRLAEIFLLEELRVRRPPAPPREPRAPQNGGSQTPAAEGGAPAAAEGSEEAPRQEEAPAAESEVPENGTAS